MNSSPSTEKTEGAAFTPAPHWNCHSTVVVFASYPLTRPFPSPVNTRPPAVAVTPPIIGCSVFTCQAILPVARFTAETLPHWASPGMATNALPSHSFGDAYGAEWVM